jgi:hypothetical protein
LLDTTAKMKETAQLRGFGFGGGEENRTLGGLAENSGILAFWEMRFAFRFA